LNDSVTPGETETPGGVEEMDNLDHEFYKFSMKIIELMLSGKDEMIE
jgi:hypothetical protein